MGHQNCRLEDGVILLWLPKCEEGTAGCEDLLNLLVAREVTNDGLVDGGGGLDRQGVHEHRRSGRHVEGSQRSLFVNGRFVRSYLAYALSRLDSLPESVHSQKQRLLIQRLTTIKREAKVADVRRAK